MAPKALTAAADSGTLAAVQVAEAARPSRFTAALAAASVTSGEHAGAKTRVRGFDHAGEGCTWASSLSSTESHSENGHVYDETAVDRQKVTNLRLPGQYDERLLGSLGLQGPYYNWNRWYLPGMGRYLELDPIAAVGGFNGGFGPDWYSYVSGSPLLHADPAGLYDAGKCQNAGTGCDDCVKAAEEITDPKLRACVQAQCKDVNVKVCCTQTCKDEAKCRPAKPGASFKPGAAMVGSEKSPGKKVWWCEQPIDAKCQNLFIVHELAHTCGWKDEEVWKGVPNDLWCDLQKK